MPFMQGEYMTPNGTSEMNAETIYATMSSVHASAAERRMKPLYILSGACERRLDDPRVIQVTTRKISGVLQLRLEKRALPTLCVN